MPLYEYRCKTCGHRFEVIQKFSDAPVRKCTECGKAVERLISSPAVQFKGTGWYVTHYGRKSPSPAQPKASREASEEKATEAAKSTDEKAASSPDGGKGKAKDKGTSNTPASSPRK